METATSYQEFLIGEFERRRKRNTSYSLRAFARDLKISAASLSKVLSGKQGVSENKAKSMAKLLGLQGIEAELFCTLIDSQHARAKVNRDRALQKLKSDDMRSVDLSIEYFKTISEWHYFAILELTELHDFKSDPKWIAERLGLSVDQVNESIQTLLTLELLELTSKGKLKKTSGYLSVPSTPIPNRHFQNHHRQLLQKAADALTEQTLEERDFSAVTFCLDSEDFTWAKNELKKFRHALTSRLSSKKSKNRLYQLNLELFALDRPISKTRRNHEKKE